MRARGRVALGAVTALAVGAGGIGAVRARTQTDAPSTPSPNTAVRTAAVTTTDLVERVTVDGTLAYGTPSPVSSPRPGTVTWLPEPGATVDRGQPVARIDERDVPLLNGSVPLWRDLAVGSDDGEDVRQLEENLVALGYGIDGLVIDAHYDWATRAAVQSWQRARGVEVTGAVGRADAVFATLPLRIAEQKASVGQQAGPGQPLVMVTGVDRTVVVRLEAARQSLVEVGDAVQIELPDRRTITGKVAVIAAQAEEEQSANGSSKPKIPVTISLDDPASAGRLDQAPVSVRITERQATGVLAVPVKALLALSEGGYAVEVVTGDRRRYVPIEVGAFAGGLVEVTGDVKAGDTVVVAS